MACRRTACAVASTRLIAWRVRSISTWWKPVGGRRSRTISAALPRAASSKPCARRRAKRRRSSLIIKKTEMAKEAERLLDGTGWLPEPLRLAETTSASSDADSPAEPLPEFLADDEDEAADTGDDEHPHAVAAE